MTTEPLTPEIVDPGHSSVPDLDTPVEYPLIAGHKLNPSHWNAFRAYYLTDGSPSARIRAAVEASGAGRASVYRWIGSDWWTELFNRHVAEKQRIFHKKLTGLQDRAVKGLGDVLDGKEFPKGGAGAVVQGAALLTKIGEKPLQDSRNITTINSNTIDNRGGLIITGKTLDQIDDHETMLKIITGEARLEDEEES